MSTTQGCEWRRGPHQDVLKRIHESGVRIAQWQRPWARGIAEGVPRLAPGMLRLPLEPGMDTRQLEARLARQWPELPMPLVHAVRTFIQCARDFGAERRCVLRIEAIESQVCPRFHVDQVALRLLQTVYGAGTEWLPERALDRSGLALGGSMIVLDADAIERVPAGDLIVMKGNCYPGETGRGLVHRSPAASPAAPRLLLAADLHE